MKGWPDLKFPPINLWNFPRQYRDFLVYGAIASMSGCSSVTYHHTMASGEGYDVTVSRFLTNEELQDMKITATADGKTVSFSKSNLDQSTPTVEVLKALGPIIAGAVAAGVQAAK